MKKLSTTKMVDTITTKRKNKNLSQARLADITGINRGMISRLESSGYTPTIDQLQALAEALDFEVVDLFEEEKKTANAAALDKKYNSSSRNRICRTVNSNPSCTAQSRDCS